MMLALGATHSLSRALQVKQIEFFVGINTRILHTLREDNILECEEEQ